MSEEKQTKTEPKNETADRVPCEVYTRIVGYLRPVQNFNAGKRQEFRDREPFDVAAWVTGDD